MRTKLVLLAVTRASGTAPRNSNTAEFAATAGGAVDSSTIDGDTLTLTLGDEPLELAFTEAGEPAAAGNDSQLLYRTE